MYRLVVYVLCVFAGIGIVFALFGRLSLSPTHMIISLVILLASTYISDRGFAKLFDIPSNMESWLITALILFLIVQPASSPATYLALGLAGAISGASKYLLTRNGKHFFNPAAFAAAFLSLWALLPTTWWIGSSSLWPFTLILGLVIVRKIKRFPLFITFVSVSSLLQILLFIHDHQPILIGMKQALIASPLIFLSTIMLTEPATMPPRRNQQIIFATLIAVLYVKALKIGPLIIYPEVALLIGNVYAYIVSPKFKVQLKLKEIEKVSDRVYNYIFTPAKRFNFLPGQYMEWTLAGVPFDSRGNRRTFTIASSPTENVVHLGLKYYEPASAFKATFRELKPGDLVYGSQLAGDFTIKGNESKQLAFIAGGIGITPFRSMIKYLNDKNITCDVVLLYVLGDPHEFAYIKVLREAAKVGIKTIPIITRPGPTIQGAVTTKLSPESISKLIPDYANRKFYISGPYVMVDTTKAYLQNLGVHISNIKTDHFSGY